MLCSACQSIFRGPLILNEHGFSEDRDHHLTAQSLAQAIRQNCYICSSTFQQYQGDNGSPLRPPPFPEGLEGTKYHLRSEDRSCYLRLSVYWCVPDFDTYNHSSFKIVVADLSEETSQFASNTASEPCWDLAKQWLSSCLTNHVRCTKILSANPYHPARVIEVAPLASSSDDELHLRIRGEYSLEIPYMTLSHCWGKSEFLKLTKLTSQRLRDGFSRADTLSKTFQDAITICQKFGVKYLWIDSLCILQDSLEDWRYEAAQMEQIYGNSLCNIAATGASSDEEGCFRDRDASLLQPCIIKSEWDNGNNRTWEIIHLDFWHTRTNQAPLNQRGWVMQERWLSPRVLHYGTDQILWECSELDACETYPDGLPKFLRNWRSGFKLDPELRKPLGYKIQADDTTPDPGLLHCTMWKFIVNMYSATSLTRGEDKLVAISGIAKRMQRLLDDEYLAGLWRKDLPFQLLWKVLVNRPASSLPLTRPRPYRAPSWSWASLDVRVASNYGEYDSIFITVLDAGVTPVGADPTGQIKDGFIRLNGRIYPAEVVSKPGRMERSCGLQVNSEDLKGNFWLDTQPQDLGTLDVLILPIWSGSRFTTSLTEGLILQAAAQGNGTYQRIGAYCVNGSVWCSFLNYSEAFKDKSLYENADGETIVLI